MKSKNNGWWDCTSYPNTTIVAPAQTCSQAYVLPNQDFYTYDGLGRTVQDNSAQDGAVISTTTTVYNGDRTTAIPPTGGNHPGHRHRPAGPHHRTRPVHRPTNTDHAQ